MNYTLDKVNEFLKKTETEIKDNLWDIGTQCRQDLTEQDYMLLEIFLDNIMSRVYDSVDWVRVYFESMSD